jgi:hypothetical protein
VAATVLFAFAALNVPLESVSATLLDSLASSLARAGALALTAQDVANVAWASAVLELRDARITGAVWAGLERHQDQNHADLWQVRRQKSTPPPPPQTLTSEPPAPARRCTNSSSRRSSTAPRGAGRAPGRRPRSWRGFSRACGRASLPRRPLSVAGSSRAPLSSSRCAWRAERERRGCGSRAASAPRGPTPPSCALRRRVEQVAETLRGMGHTDLVEEHFEPLSGSAPAPAPAPSGGPRVARRARPRGISAARGGPLRCGGGARRGRYSLDVWLPSRCSTPPTAPPAPRRTAPLTPIPPTIGDLRSRSTDPCTSCRARARTRARPTAARR